MFPSPSMVVGCHVVGEIMSVDIGITELGRGLEVGLNLFNSVFCHADFQQ